MSTVECLDFVPKPIHQVGIRPGAGTYILVSHGIIQRTAALRAYTRFGESKDWMQELSNAYVVALATRSADNLLMQLIQDELGGSRPFECSRCKDASIGLSVIRERLFPVLKSLREHANDLVHHLDDPGNKGIADLNIEGVFSYCHHLFQDNADALFGIFPNPEGLFPQVKCKKCKLGDR